MKALKEKRIGLRSLWRRGLVILSLFALVFASCDNSGGTVTGGPVPLQIRVKTAPTVDSYEGLEVNLTGIKVEARYDKDPNNWVEVPDADLKSYVVTPKYAFASGDSGSKKTFYLYAPGAGQGAYTKFETKVHHLVRYKGGMGYGDSTNVTPDSNYWRNGVQLTVKPTADYQKTYRVDDFPNLADLSKFTVQGNYMDNTIQDIPLHMDMRWEIVPYYDNAPSTGKGALAFYIGGWGYDALWFDYAGASYAPTYAHDSAYNDWVVAAVPLDEVYHVTGIEITNKDELKEWFEGEGAFFFWDDDRAAAWLEKDGTGKAEKAKIKVTYSDGLTRDLTMEQATQQNTVWYNWNPDGDYRPVAVQGIKDTVTKVLRTEKAGVEWPNYKNPKISVYYRGWRDYVDVPIFYKFNNIEVVPKAGSAFETLGYVPMDMKLQDNDNVANAAFTSFFDVYAIYSAASGQTAKKKLSYQGLRGPASEPETYRDIPVEGTNPNWGRIDAEVVDDDVLDTVAKGKPFRMLKKFGDYEVNSYLMASGRAYVDDKEPGDVSSWGSKEELYYDVEYEDAVPIKTTGMKSGTADNAAYDGGPTFYSTNFGEADRREITGTANTGSISKVVIGPYAWGEAAKPSNNGKTRNVQIYYTPGIGTASPFYGAEDINGDPLDPDTTIPSPKRQNVPVQWSNIPPLTYETE